MQTASQHTQIGAVHMQAASQQARKKELEKLGLPNCKLLVNISKANRFNQEFWKLIFRVLIANQDAVLILIDHEGHCAFKVRTKALFKKQGLENKVIFFDLSATRNSRIASVFGSV